MTEIRIPYITVFSNSVPMNIACLLLCAAQFFGFLETSKPVLRAVCADAMEFVASCPRESLDFLVVDINSSSTGDALLCPPRAFVENPFMEEALRCLRPGGVFIVNVLCRCQRNRTEVTCAWS